MMASIFRVLCNAICTLVLNVTEEPAGMQTWKIHCEQGDEANKGLLWEIRGYVDKRELWLDLMSSQTTRHALSALKRQTEASRKS